MPLPARPVKEGTYYETTASSGAVVNAGRDYLQFFSASVQKPDGRILRTLSIARTRDLDGQWAVDPEPLFPLEEQIENSAVFFQEETGTWFLFTNHVGINPSFEYTDAVWVYWTRDLGKWDRDNKAVVLDGSTCTWSKVIIGAPSVVRRGNRLHLFYDGCQDGNLTHYHRQIGMAALDLPIKVPR